MIFMKRRILLTFVIYLIIGCCFSINAQHEEKPTPTTTPTPIILQCFPYFITPTPSPLPSPTPTPTPTITPTPSPTPTHTDDFEVRTLVKYYDGAKVVSTADFPGTDLGKKINDADKFCGIGKCRIIITGNDDFYTPAYPSQDRFLDFLKGTHKSRVIGNYGRAIYPKDNTLIRGLSYASKASSRGRIWETIFVEATSVRDGKTPPAHSFIAPFNLLIIPEGESTSNITKSKNIHTIGIQFLGADNYPNDIGLSTVGIGNDDFSSVQDCLFLNTSGYGVSVGGTPGEKVIGATLKDGRTVGYHARNCAILRNHFEELLTQNLGLITFVNLRVEDNVFLNPGKLTPDGKTTPFFAVIDVEPNGNKREIIVGFICRRNLIDGRNSVGASYWTAIAYQITNPEIYNEKGIIEDNVIYGSENGISQLSIGITINSHGTYDLLVNNNAVKNAGQSGMNLSGRKLTITNNAFINVGGGGNPGISATDLTDSKIENLKVDLFSGGVPGSKEIWESGINRNNTWKAITGDAIIHRPGNITTNSRYESNILKFGVIENSASKDNIIIR